MQSPVISACTQQTTPLALARPSKHLFLPSGLRETGVEVCVVEGGGSVGGGGVVEGGGSVGGGGVVDGWLGGSGKEAE